SSDASAEELRKQALEKDTTELLDFYAGHFPRVAPVSVLPKSPPMPQIGRDNISADLEFDASIQPAVKQSPDTTTIMRIEYQVEDYYPRQTVVKWLPRGWHELEQPAETCEDGVEFENAIALQDFFAEQFNAPPEPARQGLDPAAGKIRDERKKHEDQSFL